MAKSNYSYAKRLKEIARQKKQEEKRLRKQQAKAGPSADEGLRAAGGEQQEVNGQEPAGMESGTAGEERHDEKGPEAQ